MQRLAHHAAVAAVAAALLAGCSSDSACGRLPALTQERDAARTAHASLTASGTANPGRVEASHDRLHRVEAEHHALAEACQD